MSEKLKNTQNDAVTIFQAGLKAVAPDMAIRRFCTIDGNILSIDNQPFKLDEYMNIYLVGAGKATATMEELLGERLSGGLIVVKYEHTAELNKIKTIEAGHPVPDEEGEKGARKILEIAENAGENDLLICLISGGGSALLPQAAEGVSLADKQEATRVLLACGATLHEINCIRKHLSSIKGGRNQEFAICAASDIAGEVPMVILSGGTDGNDGPTNSAGAMVDNSTIERSVVKNLDIKKYLANNDSYHFFSKLGDLLLTGPTNTNVMDLRIVLIPE